MVGTSENREHISTYKVVPDKKSYYREWVDAVIYVRGDDVFVREEMNFLQNFEQLGHWEQHGNDSKQRVSETSRQTS